MRRMTQIKKKYAKVSATVMGIVRKSNRICPVVKRSTGTAILRNSVAICGGVKVPQGIRSSLFSPGWIGHSIAYMRKIGKREEKRHPAGVFCEKLTS